MAVGNVQSGVSQLNANVDFGELQSLCKQAKDAGVTNPLCDRLVQEEPKSSWLWTFTKLGLAAGTLYGIYQVGVNNGILEAAKVAGGRFEEFVEKTANLTTEAREIFYSKFREWGFSQAMQETGDSIIAKTNGTALMNIPNDLLDLEKYANVAERDIFSSVGYLGDGPNVFFNGTISEIFKDWVVERSSPTFPNIMTPVSDAAHSVFQSGKDLLPDVSSFSTPLKVGMWAWATTKVTVAAQSLKPIVEPVATFAAWSFRKLAHR